ncbi:MAG: lyase family protein [Thaumarchaeota archaeon]|nr:lyase family protein [Nitrososphaerota archaeon]
MKYVEGARKVFMNTGTTFPREIIWSVALIKRSASKINASLGYLNKDVSRAVARAAEEVMQGRHDRNVVVDVFQTGSGTGINMNLNELIAKRASQILRRNVHPNDHVNMGQSSNDVGPTAIRIASVSLVEAKLKPALKKFTDDLDRLSARTSRVYKAGRTHLRDALPVTMGQEFGAFADAFRHDLVLVEVAADYVRELPIGGTAVGTGLNTHPSFAKLMVDEMCAATNLDLLPARNRFRATRLLTDMIALSSALRIVAIDLYRLCQDLRLMFSGPLTALGEIDIPTQEEVAGSSIMPGKTNPVTLEAAMQLSAQVIGLDHANLMAETLGEFEMSMGVPVTGYNTATQLTLLAEALGKLSSLVIRRIVPNTQRARKYAESSPALITVLSPQIGYDKAAQIGKKLVRGYSIRDAMRELGYKEAEINRILDLKKLVRPGRISGK